MHTKRVSLEPTRGVDDVEDAVAGQLGAQLLGGCVHVLPLQQGEHADLEGRGHGGQPQHGA